MKTKLATGLGALFSLLAAPALALCSGSDRLQALRGTDPAEYRAIFEAAHAEPYSEGRFWRLEKDGKRAWVLGTYHDADPDITRLPAPAAEAFDKAQRLVVEVTQAELTGMEQSFAANPALIFDISGTPLSAKVSPRTLETLRKVLPEYGLTYEVAERMQPWFLSVLLGQPACAMQAGQETPVLDRALMARAAAAGHEVIGLETGAEALDAFRSDDPAIEAGMLELVAISAVDAEDYRESAKNLYLSGELQAIWEYGKHETYEVLPRQEADRLIDLFESRLIEGRNRKWLPGLEAALEQGDTFVAVGALHLPGEAGVLNLLADQGWKVSPVKL